MRLVMEKSFEIRSKKIFKEYEGFDGDAIDFFERADQKNRGTRRFAREERKKRESREKQGESLIADDLAKNKNILGTELPREEISGEKTSQKEEGEYLWYPELPKQLIDATGYKKKEESEESFLRKKEQALRNLESRIPKARSVIEEFGPQVHWAGKILGGSKELTPWGDPQKGLDFLKNELGIAKTLDNQRRKEEKEKVLVNIKKDEAVKSELSFEDKAKIIDKADYGGALFPAYKKYLKGEPFPVGLSEENVFSQIGKLFPTFDVRTFAEEARRKVLEKNNNIEPPAKESWSIDLKDNPEWKYLSELADADRWKAKMESWDKMEKVARDREILALRGLVKIKKSGINTPEAREVWEKHKTRLESLGVL